MIRWTDNGWGTPVWYCTHCGATCGGALDAVKAEAAKHDCPALCTDYPCLKRSHYELRA